MSESDRSKRRHDDEIKSRIEWVSIGPLSLPLLRVCVLNIAIAIIFVCRLVFFSRTEGRYTYDFTVVLNFPPMVVIRYTPLLSSSSASPAAQRKPSGS